MTQAPPVCVVCRHPQTRHVWMNMGHVCVEPNCDCQFVDADAVDVPYGTVELEIFISGSHDDEQAALHDTEWLRELDAMNAELAEVAKRWTRRLDARWPGSKIKVTDDGRLIADGLRPVDPDAWEDGRHHARPQR